jgi:hypothetical protein
MLPGAAVGVQRHVVDERVPHSTPGSILVCPVPPAGCDDDHVSDLAVCGVVVLPVGASAGGRDH